MRREYEALSKLVGRNFAVLDDGISVYLTPEGEIRDVDGKILMAADAGRAKLFEKNLKSGEGGGVSREEFDRLTEEIEEIKNAPKELTETPNIVKTVSYPNVTTFEYTIGEDYNHFGYMVVERGEIKGGLLAVNFDTTECKAFEMNLYVFDEQGNPYIQTDADDVGGFKGELYEPHYEKVGEGAGFGYAKGPFTTQIPEGCTFIICMRFTNSTNAGSVVTNGDTFVEWVRSGGVTFTVTKKVNNNDFLQKNLGKANGNRYLVTDNNGDVVPGGIVLRADINPNVKSVNHRGYGTAPENTLVAYRLSKEKGFDIVECDVSMTADGIPVLLHDATIDRTSNGSGNIADLTFDEVRGFDFGSWKSAAYKGEKIPTFEEFILLCRNIGLHPYIELKSNGNYTQEQIASLVKTVELLGMNGKVTWISFTLSYLQNIADVDNAARLGYVVGAVQSGHVTSAKSLKTDANEVFIDACYPDLTESQIELCSSEGIPLEVWGTNTANNVLTCDPYVSGFTTDTVVAGVELYKYAINLTSKIQENDYVFLAGIGHGSNGLNTYWGRAVLLNKIANGSTQITVDDGAKNYVTEPVYFIAIPDDASTITVSCPGLKWSYRGLTTIDGIYTENDSGWMTDGYTYTMPSADVRCVITFAAGDNSEKHFDRSVDYLKDITVTFN